MKLLLIGINILLMALLAASGWTMFSGEGGDPAGGLEVGKKKRSKPAVSKVEAPAAKVQLKSSEEAGKAVVAKNIFDPGRCSGAVGTRGGGSAMTLVGVYQVGDTAGIIVLVKNNAQRRSAPGNRPNNNQAQAVKQYYRVGDTLANGYTLASVEIDKAILTRGAAKMTLELAKASENAPKGGGSRRRVNTFQRMVQLLERSVEQQQQQNNLNMMRFQQTENMMRNNQRGTPQRSGSSNSRGRSR